MLCRVFNSEMCLYERCRYFDMGRSDCTYDPDSKKRVLEKAYVASIHSEKKKERK